MKLHYKIPCGLPILAAFSLAATSLSAVEILWVDSASTSGGAGVAPTGEWITLLETTGGHSVTAFDGNTYNWNLSTQDDVDYVNSFDVVIITRTNNIFNTIRNNGVAWNSIATPMINLNPYFIAPSGSSSQSWNWAVGGGGQPNISNAELLDVLDETDPIWTGITLTEGSPPTVTLTGSDDRGARYYALNGGTLLPGITVVASKSGANDNFYILRAEAGSIQSGSGEKYFIAGPPNTSETGLSADGETAFLNAITILTGGTVVPAPLELSVAANLTTPGSFDFEWTSNAGKFYDLVSSTDLGTSPDTWAVWDDQDDIPASETGTNSLTAIVAGDTKRFFAIREKDSAAPAQ